MEKTYDELNARRNEAVSSDNRPSYSGASMDLLMYRWHLGKVDAVLDLLNYIEIMKMFNDPAEYILENVIDRLRIMGDYNLRLMEGESNGQGESDNH